MWSRVSLPSSTDTCTLLFTCSAVRSAPARQTRQHSVFLVFLLSHSPKNTQTDMNSDNQLNWSSEMKHANCLRTKIFPVTLHNTYLKFSLLQRLLYWIHIQLQTFYLLISVHLFSNKTKNNGRSSHTDKITLLVVLKVLQCHSNIVTICHC